jgi:phosphomannomutase
VSLRCVKAYDIRGKVPSELNVDVARALGRAYASRFRPRAVVVGRDMRLSSDSIAGALIDGLLDSGVDVVDIGLCGTEQVYFATFHLESEGVDGGIIVTASHNPADYNGMKLVQKGSVPISGDSGLKDIEALAEQYLASPPAPAAKRGTVTPRDVMAAYVEHLLGYIDAPSLEPLSIVCNAGNGCAGLVVDALAPHLPFRLTKLAWKPDGTFPNGVPNPLLEENRAPTAEAVRRVGANLGIAWDGDFDRCFFFDDQGGFVEGYYIVGLLAGEVLAKNPGAAIIHDPRLTWNTLDVVKAHGGRAVQSKTGHAFIKERMRQEDAVYGGEMSAHHYFKRFASCDSGMIPWLLVAATMSRTGQSLSQLVQAMRARYPASGELNLHLKSAAASLQNVRERYAPGALVVDDTDGVSIEYATWRLNVRASNTEPVVRVNVESRGDVALMQEKTAELLSFLQAGE